LFEASTKSAMPKTLRTRPSAAARSRQHDLPARKAIESHDA